MPTSRRSRRERHHIGHETVQHIFRAFDYARDIGRPLTHYLVIHLCDAEDQDQALYVARILHKYRDWLARKRRNGVIGACEQPAYAQTLETDSRTAHVNWAVRVPPSLWAEFETKAPRWVEKVCGAPSPFGIHVSRIQDRGYKSVANYMVEDMDPAYHDHFYAKNRAKVRGRTFGTRASFSRSLGPAARRRAGYGRPVRTRPN